MQPLASCHRYRELPCLQRSTFTHPDIRGHDQQFATLHRFFAAMSLYSDVQKRAQGELDSVLGRNRMPEAEDRARLPYVDALVKEVLRWYPAVPLGVARCTLADDEYNGFFIPKGATVLVNAW